MFSIGWLKRLSILLLSVLVTGIPACSRISAPPPEAGSVVPDEALQPVAATSTIFVQNTELQATLSIYHAWAEENRTALDNILREFGKRYPGIYFDVTYIPPESLRELYSSQFAAGEGPSILLGPVEWGPALVGEGSVYLLDEIIDPGVLENLNPAAVQASHYKGDLVSLPYAVHGVLLYRNQDLMTIHADNFDELVMLAQSASQGEVTGAYLEQSFYFSAAHLFGLGGQLMDEDGYPAFVTLEGEAWLRLLRAFQLAGQTAFLSDQDVEEFKAGRAGWIIEGSWKMAELAEAIGAGRLMVDPWPEVDGGNLSGFVQSDNLYLNSNASETTRQAARAFMEFFVSQLSQAELVQVGVIPALLYLDMPPTETSPLIAQAMVALAQGSAYPVLPAVDAYPLHLDRAIQAYLEQGIPAGEALRQASEAIVEELSTSDATPTP